MSNIRFKRPKFSEKRENVILVQDRVSKTSKVSLRPALRCRRITPWSKRVQPVVPHTVVINFGGGALPLRPHADTVVLNPPDKVAASANKLRTFELLKAANVPHVKWTTSVEDVRAWLAKGASVLARLSLSSSSGRGIRVIRPAQAGEDGGTGVAVDVCSAPLYTRYFPKTHEFRVHVVNGKAIDLTEKKLKEEFRENRENRSLVRSFDNGWVHAHDSLSLAATTDLGTIKQLGVDAVRAVGLDFGAVDILACLSVPDSGGNRSLSKAVVCEVNSAPGIENEATKNAYVAAFNEIIASKGKAA